MSNFKYLYVLTSNEKDCYYEQTLASAWTLRNKMPSANIVVLVDKATENTFVGFRQEIRNIVSEIIAVDIPEQMSPMLRSRWLKTSMYNYINSDFLYIDSDTIITQSLQDIESSPVQLGAVLDKHLPISKHHLQKRIEGLANKMKFSAGVNDNHFNSGLMLCRKCDATQKFFDDWHRLWQQCVKNGINIDQVSLAQADYENNGYIKELDGIWNCQVEYGAKFLDKAKILHLFVTGDKFNRRPHVCMNKAFQEKIKQEGLSEEVKNILLNPKKYFETKTQIIGGIALDYYNSELSRFFSVLYCQSKATRTIFNVLNAIAKKFVRT